MHPIKTPEGTNLIHEDTVAPAALVRREDANRDLHDYVERLCANDIDGCIAIEKQWGVYGTTPEAVCSYMLTVSRGEA